MELPQQANTELQDIYKKEFGIKLSQNAAKAEARRLLLFFYQLLLYIQQRSREEQDGV